MKDTDDRTERRRSGSGAAALHRGTAPVPRARRSRCVGEAKQQVQACSAST